MDEFQEVSSEYRELQKSFKDPIVLGQLLHTVAEEKKSSNLILKEIMVKLERIEERLEKLEKPTPPKTPEMISEIDDDILKFVSKKPVTSREVQKKFNYSGANGASARLNNLVRQGLLEKKQVGRRVFFQLKLR
ncbi:MAG: helix-turn-helix domain-containing protein [Candidatus Micrarchaeota archaeon]